MSCTCHFTRFFLLESSYLFPAWRGGGRKSNLKVHAKARLLHLKTSLDAQGERGPKKAENWLGVSKPHNLNIFKEKRVAIGP
jgi:hypothetical protein